MQSNINFPRTSRWWSQGHYRPASGYSRSLTVNLWRMFSTWWMMAGRSGLTWWVIPKALSIRVFPRVWVIVWASLRWIRRRWMKSDLYWHYTWVWMKGWYFHKEYEWNGVYEIMSIKWIELKVTTNTSYNDNEIWLIIHLIIASLLLFRLLNCPFYNRVMQC